MTTTECIIHHWLLDHKSGSLIHQSSGEQRRLGEYQAKLLQVLADHAGEILTREQLTALVWEGRVIGNNSLPNAIHALRVALEDDGKQQRIIKTIPKKGYILEAEFCRFASLNGDEAGEQVPTFAEPEHNIASALPNACGEGALAKNSPLILSPTRFFSHRWPLIVGVQVLLLLGLMLFLILEYFPANSNQLEKRDVDVYSQIELFEVSRSGQPYAHSEDLPRILSETLYALNQQLASQHIWMRVFYFTSNNTLNYTMTLHNKCENKQLAMNIIHWRTSAIQLNALIYRESERKLNEMAACVG